jgi:hypothetical protein
MCSIFLQRIIDHRDSVLLIRILFEYIYKELFPAAFIALLMLLKLVADAERLIDANVRE